MLRDGAQIPEVIDDALVKRTRSASLAFQVMASSIKMPLPAAKW